MQHGRFVTLTGHLNDYPLGDLVGILRHQHKTGRLLIEYPKGPAIFYFKDGELVDAQLDNLSGLQAVCVAVAQPASSFNFNPLIQPSRRSIENSLQKVVSELLGCWEESCIEIETVTSHRQSSSHGTPQPALASQRTTPALLAAPTTVLNGTPTSTARQALVFSAVALEVPKPNYSRPVLAMAAAGLMLLGLSTVIAVTGGFGRRASSPASSTSAPGASVVAPEQQTPEQQTKDLTSTAPGAELPRDSRAQRDVPRGRDYQAGSEQSGHPVARAATKPVESETAARQRQSQATAKAQSESEQEKPHADGAQTQSVKVVLRIENGRVAQASIANHRPGMDAYEALALRIAKQRRYPKAAGPETVMIKVAQSN